jgi:hypothetical protein
VRLDGLKGGKNGALALFEIASFGGFPRISAAAFASPAIFFKHSIRLFEI